MTIANERITEHAAVLQATRELAPRIEEAGEIVRQALATGHKILFCGNGGSAADSQHWAAEIVGRFQKERPSLPAIALTVDTSILTAVGNDYGFDVIFSRQVEGLGCAGDVFVGITTSGNSGNILAAAAVARDKGLQVVGLTGSGGGKLAELCDVCLAVPSSVTARVQEMHSLIGHILCEIAEREY
ncbi:MULTISPECIES: D-sedoheptulose-7-phosphate isomerase [Megasphaera]|uniref:Phosphoheptose isomerase n=1 Tax=Megasphaera vaginalis (ex Srinivasan et al. 2021) TaxID=1111454 RepID=U7URG8_9FIRM|nr:MULTISPECIES: D-sedoheptulose 7-phosphate isomerase [Megasphaera]ERT61053.1 putative phosphoheptose isomerase [Megasphaera vaginalis (ex Srinivasan et al. 2021)]